MNERIPLTNVTLGEEEAQAAAAVIRSGWVTMGAQVEAFEREFAAALDAPHAIAVTNGTVALHLAYLVAGLQAGDEFLLPGLTFVATANAGLQLGARPVPVDIAGEDDLTLCPEDLARKITRQTKLIVTMPYGGFCPAMDAICDLAAEHRIPVVEDACHAPLARLDGQSIGTFGRMATYSFFGNKNMTTGEGGMILARDEADAQRLRLLRAHGMTATTWDRERGHAIDYDVREPGFNYRMDEIRAAIGREQLKKLPGATAARAAAAGKLRRAIDGLAIPGLRIPFAQPRGEAAHHLFVVLLPAACDRRAVRRGLLERGVQSSVHYPPLGSLSALRELSAVATPRLDAIAGRLMTLPLGPGLTEEQIARIAESLHEAIAEA